MINVQTLFVTTKQSLKSVLQCIDANRQGIALVVDEESRLIDTITDGDIRRAILDQLSLDASVSELLPKKHRKHPPLTASPDATEAELLRLMNKAGIRHVPLVDSRCKVVSIALLTELAKNKDVNLRGVVMAGGFGSRLR